VLWPPSCCYSPRYRGVSPTLTSKMVCIVLLDSRYYFLKKFNSLKCAVNIIIGFKSSCRTLDYLHIIYLKANGMMPIFFVGTLYHVFLLCLSVFAINGLYTALGAPQLPNWITNGGDPCNEGWQGVSCVASNITSMYDQPSCIFPSKFLLNDSF
jgi:hypothetical protein